jgi:hypothetical protein
VVSVFSLVNYVGYGQVFLILVHHKYRLL